MKTLNARPAHRRSFFITLAFVLASSLAAVCGPAPSSAKGQEGDKEKKEKSDSIVKRMTSLEGIKKEFGEEDLKAMEEKPRGKYGYGWIQDTAQFKDPSVPVVVDGIQSLSGGGVYRGVVKIKRMAITNRSQKVVNSVELRWTIAPLDDHDKILAEGAVPFANVWVEADSRELIEVPTIYPALLLKAAAKDGVVNGNFMITIGVREARFADGSFWRRQ